jgi:hypothetical protein
MIEDYLLLEITKELYLEETGLYVASDSKAEWERVKQQFPQKYSLARSKAKAHMKDWDNDLLDEARQADYGSLIREFIFAERQENILASKFISALSICNRP